MKAFLMTLILSMAPISEVRGGIPYAMSAGIPFPLHFVMPMLANMLVVPILLFMVEPLFTFLRKHHVFEKWILAYERRAARKMDKYAAYKKWGLFLFVAIPLPTTGVYTGVVASVLGGIKPRQAMLPLLAGVFVASILTYMAASGLLGVFNLIFAK